MRPNVIGLVIAPGVAVTASVKLVDFGMVGDRASLVFAASAEISPFIEEKCQ